MFADALLATGSILRSEPNFKCKIYFDDFVECRLKYLKKKSRYPINIVLTITGDVSLTHGAFSDTTQTSVILTTKIGAEKFLKYNQISETNPLPSQVIVEIAESRTDAEDQVDFTKAFHMLKTKYSIDFLDVTAGGKTIATLTKEKLLDEFRLTIAGQLCGPFNTAGELRPGVFHLPETLHYTPETNPIVSYDGIRLFGNFHLFIRGSFIYRHDV